MGLTADIQKSLETSMQAEGTELSEDQVKRIGNLATNLADSIIDFLTKQTFTITEMKALLEVEELRTSSTLQADVLGNRLTTNVTNITGPTSGGSILPGAVGTGRSNLSPKAVRIPSLELRKFGGQGGSMKSKGHAYIGRNPVDSAETNERNTKVKLLKENIVDK